MDAILAAGFLLPPQRVEVLEVEGRWLADVIEASRHCNEGGPFGKVIAQM